MNRENDLEQPKINHEIKTKVRVLTSFQSYNKVAVSR